MSEFNVLIIDDLPENIQVLSEVLRKHGYKVSALPSGKLLNNLLSQKLPDLILLDINLPGKNGIEICRELKLNPKHHHIPILFISAIDDGRIRIKAFESGGVDYIVKPIVAQEVLARIKIQEELIFTKNKLEQEAKHQARYLMHVIHDFMRLVNPNLFNIGTRLRSFLGHCTHSPYLELEQDYCETLGDIILIGAFFTDENLNFENGYQTKKMVDILECSEKYILKITVFENQIDTLRYCKKLFMGSIVQIGTQENLLGWLVYVFFEIGFFVSNAGDLDEWLENELQNGMVPSEVLECVRRYPSFFERNRVKNKRISELGTGDKILNDLRTVDGVLLLPEGGVIDEELFLKLKSYGNRLPKSILVYQSF